ncbi:MAG TPA: adenylate/guanylate cyclase domain-containing protein, partial [Leptospiraceae bacterium]|nr:adenylate/guanylate cyclase domain-containing protein [Leptospiraceae bacterium]
MKLINSKIISPWTLEFRDKDKEDAYIDSFIFDYARNSKLVIGIALVLGFIVDLSRDINILSAFLSNLNLFTFGVFFIFISYTKYFRKLFNPLTFSSNLIFSYLAVTEVIKENGSSLEVLQIIICYTIFPRCYFKYSIIANAFTISFFSYLTWDIPIDSRNTLSEVLFFLSITIYVELAAYLKEYANRNDYLTNQKIIDQEEKTNELLLNILPAKIAAELKKTGSVKPILYENVSILFTDFKGFTSIAEKMKPEELLKELDGFFFQFDEIAKRYNLEKLKTIGDAYM